MSIRVLPQKVIQLLAAGEVVERPASVVKELIDNAVDAGGRNIKVSIRGGGITHIVVEDDGCGMAVEDLELCLRPHATSKIPDDNPFLISSLGFRGEALAAIAQVSRVVVSSRLAGADAGWAISAAFGERPSNPRPVSLPGGTRVEVSSLFAQTPARLKFLKSERSEAARIRRVILQAALAHPGVGFSLQSGNRALLQLRSCGRGDGERDRLADVLGQDFAREAISFSGKSGGIEIEGWLRLAHKKSSGSLDVRQQVVINGLPVRAPVLSKAIDRIIQQETGSDRGGDFILRVSLPPGGFDPNTHPRKEEVGIAPVSVLLDHLSVTIASALRESGFTGQEVLRAAVERAVAANEPQVGPRVAQPLGRALGQAHSAWIVCETSSGLAIIDQHAAHERIILERLRKDIASQSVPVRRLPSPQPLSLPFEARSMLLDHRDRLAAAGFEIDCFGHDSIAIWGLPSLLPVKSDLQEVMSDIADVLNQVGGIALDEAVLAAIAKAACRAAIKMGDRLSDEEIDSFLRMMEATPNASRCIHGRPSVVFLDNPDLERLFERA